MLLVRSPIRLRPWLLHRSPIQLQHLLLRRPSIQLRQYPLILLRRLRWLRRLRPLRRSRCRCSSPQPIRPRLLLHRHSPILLRPLWCRRSLIQLLRPRQLRRSPIRLLRRSRLLLHRQPRRSIRLRPPLRPSFRRLRHSPRPIRLRLRVRPRLRHSQILRPLFRLPCSQIRLHLQIRQLLRRPQIRLRLYRLRLRIHQRHS